MKWGVHKKNKKDNAKTILNTNPLNGFSFYQPVILIFVVLLFISCEKEDEDTYSLNKFWISLGMVSKDENEKHFEVITDKGDTLVPVANDALYFKPRNNQRILANYTILSKVGQSGHRFYVKINDLNNVLYKDIIENYREKDDTSTFSPIHIDEIWISGGNKLNVEFRFLGGGKVHTIDLVMPAGDMAEMEQPINLELRHNAHNDTLRYTLRALVSFNLDNLKLPNQQSVSFNVNSTDLQGNRHTFSGNFNY